MSEYYLIVRKSAGPMFELSSKNESLLAHQVANFQDKPIKIYEKFRPEGEYNIPEFMTLPRYALSKRIVHEASLEYIYGISFVLGNLTSTNINRDYYFLNNLHEIECIDLDKSEYDSIRRGGSIRGLEKLVLDENALSEIALEQRLICKVAGKYLFLFHKSIVDKIDATNPMNLTFIPTEEYSL